MTSSYEIYAAMLFLEEEFVANKAQIVQEVLQKLRMLTKLETRSFCFVSMRCMEVPFPKFLKSLVTVSMRPPMR